MKQNTVIGVTSMTEYVSSDAWVYLIDGGFEVEIIVDPNDFMERFNLRKTYKYVHQLQNLYHSLTGKELTTKEIILA